MGAVGFIAAAAGLMSAGAQYSAGRAAKRQAKANAKLQKLQSDQEQARFLADQKQKMGLARARAAASGAGGQTVTNFLSALSSIGEEQMDMLKLAGDLRVDAAYQEGDAAYAKAMSGALSSLGGSAKTAYDVYKAP